LQKYTETTATAPKHWREFIGHAVPPEARSPGRQ